MANTYLQKIVTAWLSAVFVFIAGAAIASAPEGAERTLADRTVAVGADGGSAELSFSVARGESVRISMEADNPQMQPYGFLEDAAGKGLYQPPLESARNGKNGAALAAPRAGKHSLTVFDGSNRGGTVHVVVSAAAGKKPKP